MKEHLIGILLMLCLLLAGCVDPGVEKNPSQGEDDGELLPPETELPPELNIHQRMTERNEETTVMTPDEDGDSHEDTDQADEEESAEEQTATVMAFLTKKTSVQEDDTVDDDASGMDVLRIKPDQEQQ